MVKSKSNGWKARPFRKYATPAVIPPEVLSKLASMKLEPTKEAYDQALQTLLQEHEGSCCND